MGARFRVFRGAVEDSERMIEEVNQAMAEIEAQGGRFETSHWSTSAYGGGVLATLVVVYREREEPGQQPTAVPAVSLEQPSQRVVPQ